jgi:hypothetical protein
MGTDPLGTCEMGQAFGQGWLAFTTDRTPCSDRIRQGFSGAWRGLQGFGQGVKESADVWAGRTIGLGRALKAKAVQFVFDPARVDRELARSVGRGLSVANAVVGNQDAVVLYVQAAAADRWRELAEAGPYELGRSLGHEAPLIILTEGAGELVFAARGARYSDDFVDFLDAAPRYVGTAETTLARNYRVGMEFDRYVAATKLRGLDERGLLVRQERLPTPDIEGRNYVQPDYSLYNEAGDVAAYADAKAGEFIPFDVQARGLIEWSTTTRSRTLIYYTPQGTTPIDPNLLVYARNRGVQVRQVGVP